MGRRRTFGTIRKLSRYQHATRGRDAVIAAALSELISPSAKVSSELDG